MSIRQQQGLLDRFFAASRRSRFARSGETRPGPFPLNAAQAMACKRCWAALFIEAPSVSTTTTIPPKLSKTAVEAETTVSSSAQNLAEALDRSKADKSKADTGKSEPSAPRPEGERKAPPYVRYNRKDPKHFLRTLRQNVNAYFEENGLQKTADYRMGLKALTMFALYLVPLAVVIATAPPVWGVLLAYAIMGFGTAGIGLGVMHDANHGSISRKRWVNKLLSYSMNMIGGSSFTWKIQHNVLHHSYTNIYELDEDIHDKPMLRLSPHGELKPVHRYQHIYALFLYTLATLSWVSLKDFRQWAKYKAEGLAEKGGFNADRELVVLTISKILYAVALVALPIIAGAAWWAVLLGFVLMHAIAGFIITTIFQLAHVVEGPDHYVPHPSGTMENTWAVHQLGTTANFARKSAIVTWLTGGLNHQVEHHLFPHISHLHYRKLGDIVKSTAEEFGIPYYEYPTIPKAVGSHLRVLKALGRGSALA
jgi:linoleoyl-CoA desaturase